MIRFISHNKQEVQIMEERKIGEIFEFGGEWYQCLESNSCHCNYCDYSELFNCHKISCTSRERSDGLNVGFKKLEKVGEPYMLEDKKFQKYKVFKTPYIYHKIDCSWQSFADPYYISLEIKQTKEDMEDLDKIKVRDYTKVEELNVMEEKKLNLKPFDIQKAREGKPVCTRDGRKARIICFDVKAKKPIAALITNDDTEEAHFYYDNGRSDQYQEYRYDLMMLPEKKEGWAVIRKYDIYETEEQAEDAILNSHVGAMIRKITWEE